MTVRKTIGFEKWLSGRGWVSLVVRNVVMAEYDGHGRTVRLVFETSDKTQRWTEQHGPVRHVRCIASTVLACILAVLITACSGGNSPVAPTGIDIPPSTPIAAPKPQPVCREVTIPAECKPTVTANGVQLVCTPAKTQTVCDARVR